METDDHELLYEADDFEQEEDIFDSAEDFVNARPLGDVSTSSRLSDQLFDMSKCQDSTLFFLLSLTCVANLRFLCRLSPTVL